MNPNQYQMYQNPYLRNTMYYPPQPQQIADNGITWVQGIEGAKAWQMKPNSNAILMDSEIDGRFYIKICDNVGMCSLRTFNYTEVTNQQPLQSQGTNSIDLSQYVRKDELQDLLNNMLGGPSNESTLSAN